MTRPAATPADLDWLLHVIRDSLPVALGPKPTKVQLARLARCEDFLVTALDVRRAQRTKSKTEHHRQLMETYYAAEAAWQAGLEACGWPAERREYVEKTPRPLLKKFMQDHATRHRTAAQTMVCPECGAVIVPVAQDQDIAA